MGAVGWTALFCFRWLCVDGRVKPAHDDEDARAAERATGCAKGDRMVERVIER